MAPVYTRDGTAPPTLPVVERQKAERERYAPRDPLAADPAGRRVYRLRPPERSSPVSERLRAELDEEQLAAVEGARGRSLILASAGTGKTRTIVGVLAHRVETGTAPETVVLLTFTRRAAREMVTRAGAACGSDLRGASAGTFHAVACALLRRAGGRVGPAPGFTVLDGGDQGDLMGLARDEALAGLRTRPSLPAPGVLAGWAGLAAEGGRPLEEVIHEQNPRLADRMELLLRIAEGYVERKRRIGAVDYADLLVLAERLLADPVSGRRLAEATRLVLVDELHDASGIQVRMAEALAAGGADLVAVADPDQSIYAWRGADPEAVDRFAAAPGTRVFPLQTNYRSAAEVVALAQECLPAGNPYGKRLRAARAPLGQPPVVAYLASVQEEAAFVTQRIADLMNEGREAREIAVLYRAHHHSVDLQLALSAAGVEFELYSGARFVESAHVKDVLAFCRLRHNARDELAWHRAARLFEGLGPAAAARLAERARGVEDPLRGLPVPSGCGRQAASAARLAEACARIAGLERPEAIVGEVAGAEWYRDHLRRAYANWRDREGDLARLGEIAARAPSLEGFLSDLALAERVEADEDVSGPAKRVALSTVHQAKGLEWPVVFVLQVEAGAFPSAWALSEGNLAEEERLFYVAITRARDELYLCRPMAARRPWDTGANAVVMNAGLGFLDRHLGALVEEWSVR